jgi:hypothetical protein
VVHPLIIWAGGSSLAVGESKIVAQTVALNELDLGLQFDDALAPASSVLITRLPDLVESGRLIRQWRIESRGSHRAAWKGYSLGTTSYLPFALTVTEVPSPFPNYP